MPNHQWIAIVEDDLNLREELACLFEEQGYGVHESMSLPGLLEGLKRHQPKVVVLDLNLPSQSGFEIARELRILQPEIGIIMLTARSQTQDRIQGYETGADVYLPKPIDPNELLAVVSSLERRLKEDVGAAWVLDCQLHCLENEALDVRLHLNPIDSFLVQCLAQSEQQELPVEDLLAGMRVTFPQRACTKRSLDNIISRLRTKTALVTKNNGKVPMIRSHRKTGYQLTMPIVLHNLSQ
jgi:DNA-binding response OmpR family regulator